MSIANTILTSDLIRMAESGSAKLEGRPITEPNALARANFILDHGGQTPEQWPKVSAPDLDMIGKLARLLTLKATRLRILRTSGR